MKLKFEISRSKVIKVLTYKCLQGKPEHYILTNKDAMDMQRYFNVLSKVGLILPKTVFQKGDILERTLFKMIFYSFNSLTIVLK